MPPTHAASSTNGASSTAATVCAPRRSPKPREEPGQHMGGPHGPDAPHAGSALERTEKGETAEDEAAGDENDDEEDGGEVRATRARACAR